MDWPDSKTYDLWLDIFSTVGTGVGLFLFCCGMIAVVKELIRRALLPPELFSVMESPMDEMEEALRLAKHLEDDPLPEPGVEGTLKTTTLIFVRRKMQPRRIPPDIVDDEQ